MSSQPQTDSDSSPGGTTDQRFSWEQLTLRARGPVERVQRLDEDWTMCADVDLELARPLRDVSDFVSVALPASWIGGTGSVVTYLLDEIDGHNLPEHSLREDWTIEVQGSVGDWEALAQAAQENQFGYPLDSTDGLKLLRNVAEEGVGDPNALLALVQWAEGRGPDSIRDEWLARYQQRVSDDGADA